MTLSGRWHRIALDALLVVAPLLLLEPKQRFPVRGSS